MPLIKISKQIYPPSDLIFNAFKLTPISKIKVVVVGQDPYIKPNQAMGKKTKLNPDE